MDFQLLGAGKTYTGGYCLRTHYYWDSVQPGNSPFHRAFPGFSPVPPTSTSSPTTVAAPITSTTTAFPIIHPENLSAGDPYAPELGNSGYDVQHYTIQLTLDPRQTYIRGDTLIQATSTMADLDQISLDFIGFDISHVTVDGQPVVFFPARITSSSCNCHRCCERVSLFKQKSPTAASRSL